MKLFFFRRSSEIQQGAAVLRICWDNHWPDVLYWRGTRLAQLHTGCGQNCCDYRWGVVDNCWRVVVVFGTERLHERTQRAGSFGELRHQREVQHVVNKKSAFVNQQFTALLQASVVAQTQTSTAFRRRILRCKFIITP